MFHHWWWSIKVFDSLWDRNSFTVLAADQSIIQIIAGGRDRAPSCDIPMIWGPVLASQSPEVPAWHSSSWRVAISRSIPPLQCVARMICLPSAAGTPTCPQNSPNPKRAIADGSDTYRIGKYATCWGKPSLYWSVITWCESWCSVPSSAASPRRCRRNHSSTCHWNTPPSRRVLISTWRRHRTDSVFDRYPATWVVSSQHRPLLYHPAWRACLGTDTIKRSVYLNRHSRARHTYWQCIHTAR